MGSEDSDEDDTPSVLMHSFTLLEMRRIRSEFDPMPLLLMAILLLDLRGYRAAGGIERRGVSDPEEGWFDDGGTRSSVITCSHGGAEHFWTGEKRRTEMPFRFLSRSVPFLMSALPAVCWNCCWDEYDDE